jgi:hypothetical protein
MRKRIGLVIISVLMILIIFSIFNNSQENIIISIPQQYLESLCDHPKILEFSYRDVSFKKGTILDFGADLVDRLLSSGNSVRPRGYIHLTDFVTKEELFTAPMINIRKFLLSSDGNRIIYSVYDYSDHPYEAVFLQSLNSSQRIEIKGLTPFLLDWDSTQNQVMFQGHDENGIPQLFIGDISHCFDENVLQCESNNFSVNYSFESTLSYGFFLPEDQLLLGSSDQDSGVIVDEIGDKLTTFSYPECIEPKIIKSNGKFLLICGSNIKVFESPNGPVVNYEVQQEIDYASISPDGNTILFSSSDAPDLSGKYDYSHFQSFTPMKLFLYEDNQVLPFSGRTDEQIIWFEWLPNENYCQQYQ